MRRTPRDGWVEVDALKLGDRVSVIPRKGAPTRPALVVGLHPYGYSITIPDVENGVRVVPIHPLLDRIWRYRSV